MQLKDKYDTILFDADNTLFDFDKAEALALQATLLHYGLGFEQAYLTKYRNINKRLWDKHDLGRMDVNTLTSERFRLFFIEIGMEEKKANPTEVNDLYLDELANASQLIEGATELCKELSQKHTLAIVTNGVSKTQHKRFEQSEIKAYFKEIFVSGDLGVSKPQKEFFNIVFQSLGIRDKQRVLIVGDSLGSDIKGGNQAGIDTCWFNPKGMVNRIGVKVKYEVRSLDELRGWFK